MATKGGEHRSSPWNSLEITKILIGFATPLSISLLGLIVSAKSADQAELSRELDRRLELWNSVGPSIRQMRDQAALIYRKNTSENADDQVVETLDSTKFWMLARSVDGIMEVRPFFTASVVRSYHNFRYCSLELVDALVYNSSADESNKYSPEIIYHLWEKTNANYQNLIEKVREELAARSIERVKEPYPQLVNLPSEREYSLCLENTDGLPRFTPA